MTQALEKGKAMRTFHGDPVIEQMCLDRVEGHYMADEIRKGVYWQNGKGCAIGCAVHTASNPHQAVEDQYEIPAIIARIADSIFEHLENGDSKEWPLRFYRAARPAGKDLSMVWPRFAHWLLVDPEHGVIKFSGKSEKARAAIDGVAALYARWIESGDKPTVKEFEKAAEAARAAAAAAWQAAVEAAAAARAAAAWQAAAAAAEAAEAVAAEAARAVAVEAARAAAVAAAVAAAWQAEARKSAWIRMADKLVELMAAAPMDPIEASTV